MKSKSTELTGNARWGFLQEWLRDYQIKGKFFSGIYVFGSYKNHKNELRTFRLTRILK